MSGAKCIGIGTAGAIIAGVCCLAPLLAILLGALGLSAWLAWSDYVAIVAFLGFAAMGIYGLVSRHRAQSAGFCDAHIAIKGKCGSDDKP